MSKICAIISFLMCVFFGLNTALCPANYYCTLPRDEIIQLPQSVTLLNHHKSRLWYIDPYKNNVLLCFKNFLSVASTVLVTSYRRFLPPWHYHLSGDLGDFDLLVENTVGVLITVPMHTTQVAQFKLNYTSNCEVLQSQSQGKSYSLRSQLANFCWITKPLKMENTVLYFSGLNLEENQQLVVWNKKGIVTNIKGSTESKAILTKSKGLSCVIEIMPQSIYSFSTNFSFKYYDNCQVLSSMNGSSYQLSVTSTEQCWITPTLSSNNILFRFSNVTFQKKQALTIVNKNGLIASFVGPTKLHTVAGKAFTSFYFISVQSPNVTKEVTSFFMSYYTNCQLITGSHGTIQQSTNEANCWIMQPSTIMERVYLTIKFAPPLSGHTFLITDWMNSKIIWQSPGIVKSSYTIELYTDERSKFVIEAQNSKFVLKFHTMTLEDITCGKNKLQCEDGVSGNISSNNCNSTCKAVESMMDNVFSSLNLESMTGVLRSTCNGLVCQRGLGVSFQPIYYSETIKCLKNKEDCYCPKEENSPHDFCIKERECKLEKGCARVCFFAKIFFCIKKKRNRAIELL